LTIYRPAGEGPYPLVIFNHGRAPADKRAAQGRSAPEHFARYMAAKGFVTIAPTRIGYWETYGDFDPEDNGSCQTMQVEAMSKAASDQVLATLAYAQKLPYVDASRWIAAGQSVGGLTTIATVGRNPSGLLGGINFAGGTGGNPDRNLGRPCSPHQLSRSWSEIAKTAVAPMLWLYWENDLYWGADNPKRWHQAWLSGGGKAEFYSFLAAGNDGHSGFNINMTAWLPKVDAFLSQLGFQTPAIVPKPQSTGFANITDAQRVPVDARVKNGAYQQFLNYKLPRAFAVSDKGNFGHAEGDYAWGRALGFCQGSNNRCQLYAVDDDVVWGASSSALEK
jgi:dienelactone hydrolase